MNDLISRKAALDAFDPEEARIDPINARGRIVSLPTVDAVEVARCRDCVNNGGLVGECDVWCEKMERGMIANAFCSFGKRKEARDERG